MILQSFLLGLTQGLICVGLCFPIMGTYILSKERTLLRTFYVLMVFLLGRFIGYMIFAVFTSLLGRAIQTFLVMEKVFSFTYILLGVLMVLYGITKAFSHKKICSVYDKSSQNLFYAGLIGFITGVNLCPPFFAMIVISIENHDIVKGIYAFSAFFLSTSLYLVPAVFLKGLAKFHTVRIAARIASVLVGVIFIYRGIRAFW
ncbi:MAG: sulfite exporter TauE/SafE family protein [Candidatus Aureabacteria bacterium]|nr:sulfite exporter TauE/SafE family protein [Candidatus Auribacterota bacterium]